MWGRRFGMERVEAVKFGYAWKKIRLGVRLMNALEW